MSGEGVVICVELLRSLGGHPGVTHHHVGVLEDAEPEQMCRQRALVRCRFRMYIWKQWKNPRTRVRNLMKLGIPEWRACEAVYSGKAYWRAAHHPSVQWAISNKRLAQVGYYSILDRYESLHLCD